MLEKVTAHVKKGRAVALHRNPPAPSLSLPLSLACSSPPPLSSVDWAAAYRRRALRQVLRSSWGAFSGLEHPPGTPARYLPFLLCKTKHPKPNLSYWLFVIGSDLIASASTNFDFFAKNYRVFVFFAWSAPALAVTQEAGANT